MPQPSGEEEGAAVLDEEGCQAQCTVEARCRAVEFSTEVDSHCEVWITDVTTTTNATDFKCMLAGETSKSLHDIVC